MLKTQLFCLVAAAGTATAQHSLVFAVDTNERTLDNANGLVEAGLIREDELALVTPILGDDYSASTFLTIPAQWSFIGDLDGDGRLVDSSTTGPGDDTDAVFIKRIGPAVGSGPRDVFLSKEGSAGFDTSSFSDGDVFRYRSQGDLEVFVTEAQLLVAIGQTPAGDLDLDAICQSNNGDLFVSFALTESVNGTDAEDGSIIMIPMGGILYDSNANVSAITPGAASIVATELDVKAMIQNSGVRTSVGNPPITSPTTSIDLTALELDPAGGTWTGGGGETLPNLLIAWSGFSNDGAVLTTINGGTIAVINSVVLGDTTATLGTQIGLMPDSTGLGGLMGLGIVPARARVLAVESYPTNLITTSTILYTRQEFSGATPGSSVFVLLGFGPLHAGGVLPSLDLSSIGELFGAGVLVHMGTATADQDGYGSLTTLFPPSASGSGVNLVWQVFDLDRFRLGTPAAMQFL